MLSTWSEVRFSFQTGALLYIIFAATKSIHSSKNNLKVHGVSENPLLNSSSETELDLKVPKQYEI